MLLHVSEPSKALASIMSACAPPCVRTIGRNPKGLCTLVLGFHQLKRINRANIAAEEENRGNRGLVENQPALLLVCWLMPNSDPGVTCELQVCDIPAHSL